MKKNKVVSYLFIHHTTKDKITVINKNQVEFDKKCSELESKGYAVNSMIMEDVIRI